MLKKYLIKLALLPRSGKQSLQVSADIALLSLSAYLAFAVRLDSFRFSLTPEAIVIFAITIALTISAFWWLKIYRIVIRYMDADCIKRISIAIFLPATFLFLCCLYFQLGIPRSLPPIYFCFSLISLFTIRMVLRSLVLSSIGEGRQRIVIYGAGREGIQLAGYLRTQNNFDLCAFSDDTQGATGTEVFGLPVLSTESTIELAKKGFIDTVLIADPNNTKENKKQIIEQFNSSKVTVNTVPNLDKLFSGQKSDLNFKDIQLEDIVGREEVPADSVLMSKKIANKALLITGAGGTIGSEICKQAVCCNPKTLVLLDHSEFNLFSITSLIEKLATESTQEIEIIAALGTATDAHLIEELVVKHNVDTIFHAAAYKHVPLVEENILSGVQNNVVGTEAVVDVAARCRVESFCLVSTDKAVRPTNIMGATKRIAELICQVYAAEYPDTIFSIVRFGNVLRSSGSAVPEFEKQIKQGGPVFVTHPEVTRYFMTIKEAAELVIQANSMAISGQVYILDMGDPIKIVDLVQKLCLINGLVGFSNNLAGFPKNGDIEILFTGLRPGEKLFEELLISDGVSKTDHPRISCADEVKVSRDDLDLIIHRLKVQIEQRDIIGLKSTLIEAPLQYSSSDI